MSPIPVANFMASKKTASAVNMANSNTSYRQQMAQTQKNSNNAVTSATATAVVANKSKTSTTAATTTTTSLMTTDIKLQQTKEMSSNSSSQSVNSTTTSQNVITSQCDSSCASSTTSSTDTNSVNVKNETCDTDIKTEMESAENNHAGNCGRMDSNDLQLSEIKHRPILLSSMNAHVICGLCFGYLIDATTIVECLHSFCHSCLIKHLRTEQYCPRCEMMINTAKPNIKPDTTLQAIVYKLVPGLYEKELMRKRAFYKDRPEEAASASPEQRGDDTEHLIFSPSDYMSISLEYADTDELIQSNAEYNELLKPRYLQCPAKCTVAHLKKLVYGKFEINSNRFTIDIMYKVKTIILLDHYTLMDVAYIYTWKRDAPMRFYFRVKQSLKPIIRVKKNLVPRSKVEVKISEAEVLAKLPEQTMCIVHEPTPSLKLPTPDDKILEPEEIKQENEAEVSSTTEIPTVPAEAAPAPVEDRPAPVEEPKRFEIVQPQSPSVSSQESLTDKLKITIVNKAAKEKLHNTEPKTPTSVRALKEKRESHKTSPSTSIPKDERKVENIKLKIDLSKQNSVTIINMSDPQRKEIVKPVRPEKEWKVTKTKKEKDSSPKSSPKSSPHSDRKSKTPSPLTVPPLTIKAERISPLAKLSSPTTPTSSTFNLKPEEDQKSQFLKSFSLAPINAVKAIEKGAPTLLSKDVTLSVVTKSSSKETSSSSKRKSKEPIKAIIKKPKLSPPLATEDFKIKLPPIPNSTRKPMAPPSSTTSVGSGIKETMMPPPAPSSAMKPPSALPKKTGKAQQSKVSAAPPGSLTPHPMHNNVQMSAPGSRTPIAKRYQPILPKGSRPNPFANIPNDMNKILKDRGTEIKSVPNEPISNKVYGPKSDKTSSMGPPSMAAPAAKTTGNSSNSSRNNTSSSKSASNKNNSYLNLALFNASKSKGNEAPPGCRTPMYTPNSPIYSPSSPQYVPNYNIPTMPTYKYTPKPSNSSNSYLQSVLGSASPMSGLFPSPPVKKDNSNNNNASGTSTYAPNRNEPLAQKRVYPFARSPSPVEDPPEKQLKVKSLLNSCNINIPSSLSITITREDGESSTNGAQHPKHKSPVNNYIEILKLPEQTADSMDAKRSSPPASNSLFPHPPVKRVSTPPLNTPKLGHANLQKSPVMNAPTTTTPTNTKTANNNVSPMNLNMMSKSNGVNKSSANNKTVTPNTKSAVSASDKKTPSPEKRLNTSPSEQKSPKSPNSDGSASKKFRHILPRQMLNTLPEVNYPKQSGNVIGTYSAPNGNTVKIHSNKKVAASKKSPGAHQMSPQQQQQMASMNGKMQQQQQSAAIPKTQQNAKAPAKSPQGNKVSKPNQSQAATTASVNVANKLNATPSLPPLPPVLSHSMQTMLQPHLGAAAAAPNPADINKFLKENLLRAQVQAAVANQSNMFYPYAANAAAAAQLGQFNPTMYNYQQAYIMDQLSRMQRAGNDAFTEYMQKLKNSMEIQKSAGENKLQEPKSLQKNSTSPKSLANSPSTSASNNMSPKEQLTAKTK